MRLQSFLLASLLMSMSLVSTLNAQTDTPGTRSIAIYQNGFSLVHETRSVDLTRGNNQVHFRGFPDGLQFETMLTRFNGTLRDVRRIDGSTGYDEILRRLRGKEIRLDHFEGGSVTGILKQISPGLIVIEQADGSHVFLQSLTGYRLSAAEMPDLGGPFPYLSIDLEARQAGSQSVGFYYLLNGLGWQNAYSIILSENERQADLSGWTNIRNTTGTNFEGVKLQLVAGQINVNRRQTTAQQYEMMRQSARMMVESDYVEPEAQEFGDLQLYDLPGTFDIAPNETRRIALVEGTGVGVSKRYRYTSTDRSMETALGGLVRVSYDLQNTDRNKLGKPLPSGQVRIYKQHQGQLLMLGEDQIGNTPVGGQISISTGFAFDILTREHISTQTRISDRISEQTNEITLVNQKSEKVTIEVDRFLMTSQRITRSSIPVDMVSANRGVFKVELNPGQSYTLSFTVRTERM